MSIPHGDSISPEKGEIDLEDEEDRKNGFDIVEGGGIFGHSIMDANNTH